MLSNIVFPELSQSNKDKTALLFCLETAKNQLKKSFWLHHWFSPSGEELLSYGKQIFYHWLRFPNLADFRISETVREISCYPLPGIPEETIRHLFLDQVLPRCLAHQGRVMLHASAVKLKQGLLLFIGDSGVGKSTLAGNFHQAGQPAVSDDCLWVKENKKKIMAVPSYGGLRLWEDSREVLFHSEEDTSIMAHYSSKRRVSLKRGDVTVSKSGLPILAVIAIAPPGQSSVSEIILDRLSPRESFIAIMKQTFQLDLNDLERVARHMQALGRIVPRLPTYRLSMPHDYDLLPLVRKKILEAVL